MKTWIILIRGINVGGNNIVPMQKLREILEQAGYTNVRTYIQTGNVVFDSEITTKAAICKAVGNCMEAGFGFRPRILALSANKLKNIIKDNPFPKAVETPKFLHVFFLARPAENADLAVLETVKAHNERFYISKDAAYLHLPDGVWKSKLAAKLEACLGVEATARNWRSVGKILDLVQKKP